MPKPVKQTRTLITVAADDIARGVRFNSELCPIAHAVRRKLRLKKQKVAVECGRRRIVAGQRIAALPHKAWLFATDFDDGKQVTPSKFVLRFK